MFNNNILKDVNHITQQLNTFETASFKEQFIKIYLGTIYSSISTLRFCNLPSSVKLVAIGLDFP